MGGGDIMKEWPEGNEIATFGKIAEPLKAAILFGYKVTRKAKGKDVPYDGYGVGVLNANCSSPEDALKAEGLEYSEERGRDLLDEIIGIAIQLGMEQGRRMTMKQFSEKRYIIARAISRETEKILEEAFNG